MSNHARKKERHRLKRKEKQLAVRRAHSGSPYRRIGLSGGPFEAYVNRDWKRDGQASIVVLRRVPGGGHAMAAFLVDIRCPGLKDAWGRLDITPTEFRDSVLGHIHEQVECVRCDEQTARRLVAGGIRFAHDNGFRLPLHYERWVSMLGDIGDWRTADLSDFGHRGKLLWVGSLEDLRRRLVGCSVEQFLARSDVEYVFSDDDFTLLDDESLEFEQQVQTVRQKTLDAVRRWCFANQLQPHPHLAEALDALLEAITQGRTLDEDDRGDDEPTPAQAQNTTDMFDRFLSLQQQDVKRELHEAMEQIMKYAAIFESSEEFFDAVGVGGSEPESK